jgi:hypothetical protein
MLPAAALLSAAPPAHAQTTSLGSTLEDVGEEYARRYAQPAVDAVGANLNSGFFYKSGVGDGGGLIPGVDLYLGVKAFASQVPDADRTLSLSYSSSETITFDNGVQCTTAEIPFTLNEVPTALGSRDAEDVVIKLDKDDLRCDSGVEPPEPDDITITPLSGVDLGVAPLAVPQAGVGIAATGTQLSLRYLPNLRYKDWVTMKFIGGGLRQEITRFLPMLPLDLSTHLFYQSVSFEEELISAESTPFMTASTWAGGVSASKTLSSVVTFYGSLQFERTRANVEYTFDPGADFETRTLGVSFSGANSFRVIAGASLGLGPVVLNVDVSQGQRRVLSAGLGFQL